MKKYSLCITTYNRYDLLLESFAQVINDERIEEIVICDDNSEVDIWNKLVFLRDNSKIKLFRNYMNLGMLANKAKVLSLASNEWAILADSDNIYRPDYLDSLEGITLSNKTVYMPEFAYPGFDYRPFSGKTYDISNIKELIKYPMGTCCFNTCSYVLNKNEYKFVDRPDVKAADTIYMNYLMLQDGFSFYVTPGMQYFHRQHDGSGFLEDVHYNLDKAAEIKNLILSL